MNNYVNHRYCSKPLPPPLSRLKPKKYPNSHLFHLPTKKKKKKKTFFKNFFFFHHSNTFFVFFFFFQTMFSKLPTLVLCCSLISSGLGFGGREPKNTAPRDCYKAGMKNGPGIGFDLSSSYGYVYAIRCFSPPQVPPPPLSKKLEPLFLLFFFFLLADFFFSIAAIRHLNGTIDDVAYVEIDADYRDMMKRFSFDSSKHPR